MKKIINENKCITVLVSILTAVFGMIFFYMHYLHVEIEHSKEEITALKKDFFYNHSDVKIDERKNWE